jgi:hypothetical protein
MEKRPRAALLDTNLLLLWIAGTTDLSLFKTFKRVQSFTAADYLLLTDALAAFVSLVTTAHILAEASNFLDQAPPYRRSALLSTFREYIDKADEIHLPARQLSLRPEFAPFGLTDTGIAVLGYEATVITTDFRLRGTVLANAGYCVHLQDLRDLARS